MKRIGSTAVSLVGVLFACVLFLGADAQNLVPATSSTQWQAFGIGYTIDSSMFPRHSHLPCFYSHACFTVQVYNVELELPLSVRKTLELRRPAHSRSSRSVKRLRRI
jgi:hypothetical protein